MLMAISFVAQLAICSIDLLVTALLIEILFLSTVLWLLFGTSKTHIKASLRYFIFNAIGGGLFLFASGNYYLVAGTTAYYVDSVYSDKLGIYCLV